MQFLYGEDGLSVTKTNLLNKKQFPFVINNHKSIASERELARLTELLEKKRARKWERKVGASDTEDRYRWERKVGASDTEDRCRWERKIGESCPGVTVSHCSPTYHRRNLHLLVLGMFTQPMYDSIELAS